MHAKNDPVGVQGVLHREALTEELRVPGDFDADTLGCEPTGPLGQLGGRAHRHRRLADDDRGPLEPRHQGVDHGVDVAVIRAVLALLLRGSDAEAVYVREGRGRVVVGGEVQPARIEVVPQDLSQPGLVERDVTRGELGHLAGVDVDPKNLVTQFGHAGGMGRAEVPRTEHSASHTA